MVLDVGTGSGILSFFAIQAGARHVYAVDASNITAHCQQLVNSNGLANRITVINGKMEEVCVEPVISNSGSQNILASVLVNYSIRTIIIVTVIKNTALSSSNSHVNKLNGLHLVSSVYIAFMG